MKKDNITGYPNFYVSKRGRVWKRIRDGTWKENTQQMMMEGRNRGQFKPTITKQQVSLILEKYATGKYSQIQLARLVGLKSQGRISRIINKYSSVGLE